MKIVLFLTLAMGMLVGCCYFVFTIYRADSDRKAVRYAASTTHAVESRTAQLNDQKEIRRLRAQLEQKNKLISSLVRKSFTSTQTTETAETPPQQQLRKIEMMKVLDDRMADGDPSSYNSQSLKTELQSAIDTGILGVTEISALSCSQGICRLELSNQNRTEMENGTDELARKLGKTFNAVTAFKNPDGSKMLYMAQNSEDLDHTLLSKPN